MTFPSRPEYESLVYSLLDDNPEVVGSTLRLYSTSALTAIVEGHVTRPGGPYGQEIAATIPQALLEPLPGDTAQTVNLHVHVTGKSGWLRSTNCAPHSLAVNFRSS